MYGSISKFLCVVLLIICLQFCIIPNSSSTEKKQTPDTKSEIYQPIQISMQERADTLMLLYKRIQESKDTNSLKVYKTAFLKLFPHSFSLFNSIYGYDDENGARLLYYEAENHTDLFFNLESINQDAFIKKVIDISLNGHWEADAINYFRMKMKESLLENPELYYVILNSYSESEILSFWHFFYDGPHPKNYENIYKELYSRGFKLNKDISKLMQKAYSKLLLEKKSDG